MILCVCCLVSAFTFSDSNQMQRTDIRWHILRSQPEIDRADGPGTGPDLDLCLAGSEIWFEN